MDNNKDNNKLTSMISEKCNKIAIFVPGVHVVSLFDVVLLLGQVPPKMTLASTSCRQALTRVIFGGMSTKRDAAQ